MGCLLPYDGEAFSFGSGRASVLRRRLQRRYHTTNGVYEHQMGIVEGGKLALLAGVGPMGLAAIDYIIHADRRPSLLVVTDIDDARLKRAAGIYTVEEAKKFGVELHYVNTGAVEDPVALLKEISGGTGYNDVHVMAPVAPVISRATPSWPRTAASTSSPAPARRSSLPFNFYNVHYASTHIVGTSGGNTDDMKESLRMMEQGLLNPAGLVTHIGGLDSAKEVTLNLPSIPGGKKLIYTNISLPITAITEFAEKGKTDPLFAKLDRDLQSSTACGRWRRRTICWQTPKPSKSRRRFTLYSLQVRNHLTFLR